MHMTLHLYVIRSVVYLLSDEYDNAGYVERVVPAMACSLQCLCQMQEKSVEREIVVDCEPLDAQSQRWRAIAFDHRGYDLACEYEGCDVRGRDKGAGGHLSRPRLLAEERVVCWEGEEDLREGQPET